MTIDPSILQRCWFLAGPTACGKSAAGLVLAERLNAEIISLDSMSIYRGMDVGTAKPTKDEQQRVPHHLLDMVDPHEEFSVADYVARADSVCREIVGRNRIPLFVGGTGLYLRSVLRGVFEGPPADAEFRRDLESQAADSPGLLHDMLRDVDPDAADSLHPNDHRRLIRALEVVHVTGRPLSQQQQQEPLPESNRPPHVYWLSPPRDWLHDRINRRVLQMIDAGLVDETAGLLQLDNPPGRTARQALGCREIIEHLEGMCSLEKAVETIQTRTRQFAKRQHTWFRNLVECREVAIDGSETPAEIADRLAAT